MKKRLTSKQVEELIKVRLSIQSTQRNLMDNYNIKVATWEYFKSRAFFDKIYSNFSAFQKKNFLVLLAGVYWAETRDLLEAKYSTLV